MMRVAGWSAAVLALLLALGLAPAAASSPTADCATPIPVETFDVRAEPRRDSYRIGETARVDIFVTDSLTGLPASDVHAGVIIDARKDHAVFDYGKTDERGHLALKLRLRAKAIDPGWAHTIAYAWDWINTPVYCDARWGDAVYPRFFRITE